MTEIREPVPAPRGGFFLRRRSVPLPTWRLWLLLLAGGAALLWAFVTGVHGWLAVNEPDPAARVLVVEGWVPDYVISTASQMMKDGKADRVLTTGVPVDHGANLLRIGNTYANVAATLLTASGVEAERVRAVPCDSVKRERTRSMAGALRDALAHDPVPASGKRLNLISLDTHARRSRAIYQEVLGPEWTVGIIAVPTQEYDPARWYRQSAGVKSVLNEVIGLTMFMIGEN